MLTFAGRFLSDEYTPAPVKFPVAHFPGYLMAETLRIQDSITNPLDSEALVSNAINATVGLRIVLTLAMVTRRCCCWFGPYENRWGHLAHHPAVWLGVMGSCRLFRRSATGRDRPSACGT